MLYPPLDLVEQGLAELLSRVFHTLPMAALARCCWGVCKASWGDARSAARLASPWYPSSILVMNQSPLQTLLSAAPRARCLEGNSSCPDFPGRVTLLVTSPLINARYFLCPPWTDVAF